MSKHGGASDPTEEPTRSFAGNADPHFIHAEPAHAAETPPAGETPHVSIPVPAEIEKVPAADATTSSLSTTANDALLTLDTVNVEASWGHIYGPVSFSVKQGGVTVIVGHGGRGRTALLLTLAGRMKPSNGTITAFGTTNNAHALFKRAGVAFINEVDEIVQAIRVRDVVTEFLRWGAKWHAWVPPATPEDLERMCRPVFGDLEIPDINAMVEELPELTAALFRIAAANARNPELLVVGGIDNLTSTQASEKLLERLVALGKHQTIITADVNGQRFAAPVTAYIEVDNLTNKEFVNMELEEIGAKA